MKLFKLIRWKLVLLIYVMVAYSIILTSSGGYDAKAYENETSGEKFEQYSRSDSSPGRGLDSEGTPYDIFEKYFADIENGKHESSAGKSIIKTGYGRTDFNDASVIRNDYSPAGDFIITAYTLREEECGKAQDHPLYGQPAISGSKYANFETVHVKANYTIAADWDVLMPGTAIMIEGLPYIYVVEDKGGAIKGNRLDIYMTDLDDALEWGVQERKVWIIGEWR
jgi:3D (Asp-Asp-Asp) domain-containing protein